MGQLVYLPRDRNIASAERGGDEHLDDEGLQLRT